jgi:hypothetical protein
LARAVPATAAFTGLSIQSNLTSSIEAHLAASS